MHKYTRAAQLPPANETLAAPICQQLDISDIQTFSMQHKISLYADDIFTLPANSFIFSTEVYSYKYNV